MVFILIKYRDKVKLLSFFKTEISRGLNNGTTKSVLQFSPSFRRIRPGWGFLSTAMSGEIKILLVLLIIMLFPQIILYTQYKNYILLYTNNHFILRLVKTVF